MLTYGYFYKITFLFYVFFYKIEHNKQAMKKQKYNFYEKYMSVLEKKLVISYNIEKCICFY